MNTYRLCRTTEYSNRYGAVAWRAEPRSGVRWNFAQVGSEGLDGVGRCGTKGMGCLLQGRVGRCSVQRGVKGLGPQEAAASHTGRTLSTIMLVTAGDVVVDLCGWRLVVGERGQAVHG